MINKINRYLTLKKIDGYKQIDGWVSPDEANGLFKIARKLGAHSTVVEIGSWQGKSTYCIAKGLKSGTLYAIDPFNADGGLDTVSTEIYVKQKSDKDLLTTFLNNMKRLKVDKKIITKKGYSNDFASQFTQIDFLFIDGDHSIEGCKNDYNLYAHKVSKGGFIAFHDYYEDRPDLGPTFVIQNLVTNGGFRFYAQFDSLWIGIKN